MLCLYQRTLLIASLLGIQLYGLQAENEPSVDVEPVDPYEEIPWSASAQFGFGLDSEESLAQGGGEILGPIWQDGDSILFLNAWMGAFEHDEQNYSLGAGFRQLMMDESLLLGVNMFYDHGEVGDIASFNRFGFGLELLSQRLDFRFNGYFADNDKVVADPFSVLSYGDPFASGHSIFQPLTVVGVQSLNGVEFEVGRQFSVKNFDLGIFGGAYHLWGADDTPSQNGFRARAELALTDRISLDAAYFGDDTFVGGNAYVGLRASIPLGRQPDVERNRGLRDRMGERVVRHHRVFHTDEVVVRETLEDDVVFVNNGSRRIRRQFILHASHWRPR